MMLNLNSVKTIINNNIKNIIINRTKLFFCVIFIFGLWLGVDQYLKNISYFDKIIINCINYITENSYLKSVILISMINLLIINTAFFSGFNCLGLPIIIISPLLYGILIGIINSWLFISNKINGVFYSSINIIPFALIISILIFITCSNSFDLSKKSVKGLIYGEQTGRGEIKNIFINHLIVSAVIIITSSLQTLLIIKLTDKLITTI